MRTPDEVLKPEAKPAQHNQAVPVEPSRWKKWIRLIAILLLIIIAYRVYRSYGGNLFTLFKPGTFENEVEPEAKQAVGNQGIEAFTLDEQAVERTEIILNFIAGEDANITCEGIRYEVRANDGFLVDDYWVCTKIGPGYIEFTGKYGEQRRVGVRPRGDVDSTLVGKAPGKPVGQRPTFGQGYR